MFDQPLPLAPLLVVTSPLLPQKSQRLRRLTLWMVVWICSAVVEPRLVTIKCGKLHMRCGL
jgi:hypothetical protein